MKQFETKDKKEELNFNPFSNLVVDRLVDEWKNVLPSEEIFAKPILARISRIQILIDKSTKRILSQHKLSETEYRLLAGLKRSGPPYSLSPSQLSPKYVPVTSGGLTGVINRLEKRRLVKKLINPHDGRSVIVTLTQEGSSMIIEAMEEIVRMENSLVSNINQEEIDAGSQFLKSLLNNISEAIK